MSDPDIVDLFAGPGGWDEGLRLLGITGPSVLRVEFDPKFKGDGIQPANATALAAGHGNYVQADIATLDPRSVAGTAVRGLIGSPPCPGFSGAGKGLGRKDLVLLLAAIADMGGGYNPCAVLDGVRSRQHDARSALTLEPLRWALDLYPEWIALEQVPAVLPLWEAYAEVLRADGYDVWTGYATSEQHGVAQTRKRAGLRARRRRGHVAELGAPVPTHSRFHSRSPERLDPGVLKWVSMAEAIGRGLTMRPAPTITGGGTDTGGAEPIAHLARWLDRPDWAVGVQPSHMGDVRNAHGCVRSVEQPAPTMTASMDNGNFRWVYRNGNQAHSARRPIEHPAPTVHFGARSNKVEWIEAEAAKDPKASGVRVTVQEAGILQSFPADYPWQGTQSQQFQQAGNAVPPLMAAHILAPLVSVALEAAS